MHFVQTCRSQHENLHLFKSRGRLHVVQLLDRTEDGRLVFEKYPRISLEAFTAFDVMEALHSRGFVHRDVVARNFLQVVTGDGTLVACDLETDHASVTCKAPELSVENPPTQLNRTYTALEPSCLSPFYDIFSPPAIRGYLSACLNPDVKQPPTLYELRHVVENIEC